MVQLGPVQLGPGPRKTLYRSEPIVGSLRLHDPGPIELPTPTGEGLRTVSLIADTAHASRPPGADPLNIRDTLDWIEPELELDPLVLRGEVRRRLFRAIPAFDDWTSQASDPAAWSLANRWNETDSKAPTYRLLVAPREPFASVVRTLTIGARHNWLALVVRRFADDTPAKIQVEFDGQRVGSWDVPPDSKSSDPNPLLIPLGDRQGQKVAVKLTPLPLGPNSWIDWRQLALLEHPPGSLLLFDEEPEFVSALRVGDGKASLQSGDGQTGDVSLRISGKACEVEQLAGLPVEIRARPKLGQFRYLRFAWKAPAAAGVTLTLGHDGQFGPVLPNASVKQCFRYEAGRKGGDGPVLSLNGRAPEKWTVYTRDLYADFGEFTFTGLSFGASGPSGALFDDLRLVRTPDDLPKK